MSNEEDRHKETGETQLPDDNHIILKICVIIVEPGSIPAQSLSGDAFLSHQFFKIGGGVLAGGADEVCGEFIPDVFIAADGAAPDGLALLGFFLFRLRLDVALVIGIGGRGGVGEDVHICDFRDEQDMGSQVDSLFHLGGDPGVGAFGDGQGTVCQALYLSEGFELIHADILAALEAEALEKGEGGLLGDDRGGENAGVQDHAAGIVGLVHRHGDPVRFGGYLGHGVGDAAVVKIPSAGCDDKQAVGNGVHGFLVHACHLRFVRLVLLFCPLFREKCSILKFGCQTAEWRK